MSDEKKSWEKPLYPKEIAENASNWSFASDLSLLKYLEVFSEDLLNKATTVDNNVNALLNNLSKATLSLEIAKNEFLSLSNTQFIESRVYEDDETLLSNEEKIETEEPDEKDEEEFDENELRLAAERGVEVIQKYFDKVEISDSDSEGDNFTSFMLRPKNPYANRPLPYVIGSKMWYKKWHVGLVESSSDSEDEKISEKYTETDSESDLPNTNVPQTKSISLSESPEIDLSNKLDLPVANSTFNDTNKQDDYLGSSAEYNSAQAHISQNLFAEQLAAKLDDVVKNENLDASINRKPIKKSNNYGRYDNVFLDEPPPLDDTADVVSPKSKDQGIFSGGDGLFDDLDDDQLFWGTGVVERQSEVRNVGKATPNLFNEDEDLFIDIVKDETTATSDNKFKNGLNNKLNKSKGPSIFDDDNESEEDSLFGKPSIKPNYLINKSAKESLFDEDDIEESPTLEAKKKSSNLFGEEETFESKKQIPLFDDENPLNIESPKRKAPVGGIQVINNPNLFSDRNVKNLLKNKPRPSLDSSGNEPDESDTKKVPTKITPKVPENDVKNVKEETRSLEKEKKSYNLFDDDEDDDLFKDDLFSNTSSKKTNIFAKKGGLFDDINEQSDEEDHLEDFESKRNERDSLKYEESKKKVEDQMKKTGDSSNNQLEEEREIKFEESSKIEDQVKKAAFKDPLKEDVGEEKVRNIIFGDEESDSDDLFYSKQSKNKVIGDVSILKVEPEKIPPKEKRKIPSLFDDDDDYEDDLFSSNFLKNKKSSSPSIKTEKSLHMSNNLFDDEDDLFSVINSVRREKKEQEKIEDSNTFQSGKKVPLENEEEDILANNSEDEFFKPTKAKSLTFKHKLFEDDEELGDDIFGFKSHQKKEERGDKPEETMKKEAGKNKDPDELGDDLFGVESRQKNEKRIEEWEVKVKNEVGRNEDDDGLDDDIFGKRRRQNVNEERTVESIGIMKKGIDQDADDDELDDNIFGIRSRRKKNEESDEETKGILKKGVGQNENGDGLDDDTFEIKSHRNKNEDGDGLGDDTSGIESHQKKNEEMSEESKGATKKRVDQNEDGDGLNDTSGIKNYRKKNEMSKESGGIMKKDGQNIETGKEDLQDTREEINGVMERRNEDGQIDRKPLKKDNHASSINDVKIEEDGREETNETSIKKDRSTYKSTAEEADRTNDSSINANHSIRNKFSSTAARIPTISIFDPNPPDLEDWDARLEPNAFEDEIYSLDSTDNFDENRSSIFDREPPSVFNESSGIVKDQSVSTYRAETDISSFYPYASSSRRFSTDLFNEESADSLLTTQPRHSYELNIPPSITENSEGAFSNLEITPSGRLDELYSEISEPIRSTKGVTFEDDVDRKRETRSLDETGKTEKASEVRGEDVRVEKPKPVISKKPDLRTKVGKSINEEVKEDENNGRKLPDVAAEMMKENQIGNEGSPGKLKHNLNINVSALLPGAGKLQKKEAWHPPQPAQRSVSLDTDERTPDRAVQKSSEQEMKSEIVHSTIENVKVLESITKSRARGPVKRRPSTKRGREAIRNSCVDLTFVSSPTTEDENETKDEVVSNEKRSFKDELQAQLIQSPKSKQATPTTIENETKQEVVSNEKRSFKDELQAQLVQSSKSKQATPTTIENETKQELISNEKRSFKDELQAQLVQSPKSKQATPTTIENETKQELVSNEKRSFKDELRAELIRSPKSKQATATTIENTSVTIVKEFKQNNKVEEIQIKSNTKSIKKDSNNTEDVPKIKIETSDSQKTSIIKESKPKRVDINDSTTDFTTAEHVAKSEMKTENVIEYAETSTGRIRRIDRLGESKPRVERVHSRDIFDRPEGLPKIDVETSNRSKRDTNFLNDPVVKETESDKGKYTVGSLFGKTEDVNRNFETSSSRRSKRSDFLGELIRNKDDKNKTTGKMKESKTTDIFKTCSERSTRTKNLFGDDDDDDDEDLFSSFKKTKKKENVSNFLAVGSDNPFFDVTRRSSFVKTDNFASPEFIKENLSEDEENDDVFSEKKLPPKSDILKRSPFDDDDDDDDDDLLGSGPKDRKQASVTTSTTTRRLKTLKKLENTIVTGDDPLSALDK